MVCDVINVYDDWEKVLMIGSILVKIENYHKRLPDRFYEFFQKYIPNLDYRYLSTWEIAKRYFQNRNLKYKIHCLEELLENKKSDTLFILGSNKSVNKIQDSVWVKLKQFDTLGFNFWIYHKFVPTYFISEYGKDKRVHKYLMQQVQNRSSDYRDTIFLVSTHEHRKGRMPRLMPESFASNPNMFNYLFPKIVECPGSRPFKVEDFKKSIFYRGSLNHCLYIARILQFKKIALLGCEMDSAVPFYNDYLETQWIYEIEGYDISKEEKKKLNYLALVEGKGKHNIIDTILAINDYVFKPEGIELYVFNKKSLLYPKIPLFEL